MSFPASWSVDKKAVSIAVFMSKPVSNWAAYSMREGFCFKNAVN
jgi:hypothetical protein